MQSLNGEWRKSWILLFGQLADFVMDQKVTEWNDGR